ncbi:MAG TPA: hypothetical protein VGO89_10130, partial [Streptomyces sp.]|nr:hypothetical protein [Streptomyces sp.]
LRPGQAESLASRLIQLAPPFFSRADDTEEAFQAALQFHGWPLVWARDAGMFTGERVGEWRRLHNEIVGRLTKAEGGIPLTLARIVAAWCVGAYMLGELLGMPELGARAEEDARAELPRILGDVAETHLSPGQVLWEAVAGAIAQEPAAWVPSGQLSGETAEGFPLRKVLGYHHQGRVHVYVSTLKDAATAAKLDSPVPGLKDLKDRGVLITEESTKFASKHPTRTLRDKVPGRVYVFDTEIAQGAFADRESTPDVTPDSDQVPAPADDSATVASEQRATDAMNADQPPTREPVTSRAHDVVIPPQPTHRPTVGVQLADDKPVYPQAVQAVTDTVFAGLVDKASGRTLSATRFGVLGDGVLHLPNCEAVPLPSMPGSVDDLPGLMDAYQLKTLWVHEAGARSMGLPSFEDRKGLPVLARAEQEDDGVPHSTVGPQTPVEHPWAMRGQGSPISKMAPEGLASWMTLIMGDDSKSPRLQVSLPMYDSRIDKAKQEGRGGFGGAPDPETLLDALMLWTTSTVHGPVTRPKVIPYYMSPNRTGEDFAGGRERTDVTCEAIREKLVPPAKGNQVPLMVPQHWQRKWPQISDAERGAKMLHEYDKTAAWLGAFSNVRLGIGEPVNAPGGTAYDKRFAGYWRIADVPGHGIEGLPELKFRKCSDGGYWVTTPSMDLLLELYPDWEPDVLEAWIWEKSKRALEGMYKRLAPARKRLVVAAEQGRPGAKWAKQVNGRVYQSFRGYLGRATGPQKDHTTGGLYAKDIYYRPDWGQMVIAHATANMYRDLVKFAKEGRPPLSVYVDAITLTSDEPDPIAAKPGEMVISQEDGGAWTDEGSAPMAELLPVLEQGTSAHHALDAYLTDGGE